MTKYAALGDFLAAQRNGEVRVTFDEIERITGVKLPPKAQHHRAWWSNNPSNNVMTRVWLDAGFESAQVDMNARKLVFRRAAGDNERKSMAPDSRATKLDRHPAFGALKGLVRIPPGVDLTEPADPEWADLVDKKYGPPLR